MVCSTPCHPYLNGRKQTSREERDQLRAAWQSVYSSRPGVPATALVSTRPPAKRTVPTAGGALWESLTCELFASCILREEEEAPESALPP